MKEAAAKLNELELNPPDKDSYRVSVDDITDEMKSQFVDDEI